MKLTTNEWLHDGRWMGRRRMAMVLIMLAVSIILVIGTSAYAQSISTTTVQGTVYLANGQPGSGTLSVSWPEFTTASGQAVAADQMTVTIGSDGFLSLNLTPNLGATPAGLYYTVVYYLSDGTTSTEYWVVPATPQATLGSVRAQLMPAAQAVQAVNKAYVDEAISELATSQLTAAGGTLTGPLYLSGDPTQALQAADKHYVDESAALAVPLAGGAMAGALTGPSITANQLGGTYQADQFAGVDFGAKLQACLSSLSTIDGGTCDARNFTGSQSMGSSLTISTGNASVLLPCATIATANQIIVTAGTRNVALRGCALRGGSVASGSQGGTVFEYSGPGAMVQVGDPTYAADTLGFHMDNAVINTAASASATAQGLIAYRTQEMDLDSLYFLGNSNQTGITLDGTGNYTGGTFFDNEISGFQTAVNAIGHQITNPATTDWVNASTFVRLHIDCPTSGGSPISGTYGINLQQGDGNTFAGGDVEGCSTALHLGANAQNNTIVGLRNENSTNQVVADAGSSYNSWMTGGTMFTGQLTDNGTRNSFLDTFHRSFNGINGDWYGSQQDATVTNHFRVGIGAGNERGLQDRYQTDYGYRWTMGLSDATAGEQFYQILDELNNVYRISIGQYNNGQSSTNNQTAINSAGSGAVVLNGSNNSGSGGVIFGSGGANDTTVATINNAGNAQFNGTLQVGGASTFTGSTTVKNQADAEIDATLWAGLTASQKESYIYKDWNGNSQWYLEKDASNSWAVNSATGGLDSFKAYQSTNSGDTYIDTSNSSGVVRINYETGSGTQFKVYGGNSSTLYASFTGTASIQFPGLAASSGYNCLQIDNSGYITNTGAACGSGGGNGTVNSGTAGQIAYYSATGSAVTGITSIPITAGGTGATTASSALSNLGAAPLASPIFTGTVTAPTFSGSLAGHSSLDLSLSGGALTGAVTNSSTIAAAGLQDTLRPVVDTFTISTGYGGGTDECAKLAELSYNADQAGYSGNIFRSTGSAVAPTINCSTPYFFDPFLLSLSPNGNSKGITKLQPGYTYNLAGELDVPSGYIMDGQVPGGAPSSGSAPGSVLAPGSGFTYNPNGAQISAAMVNLGHSSQDTGYSFSLSNQVNNVGINCYGAPGLTGAMNGLAQQDSGFSNDVFKNCAVAIDEEDFGTAGGSQSTGPNMNDTISTGGTILTPSMTGMNISAGGSYSQAPAITVTGCTTAPSVAAIMTSTAVTGYQFSGPNYYGTNCSPTGTTISFATTYGSGAVATPIVQGQAPPVGMQVGAIHEADAGIVQNLSITGGQTTTYPSSGMTVDGNALIDHLYCESLMVCLTLGSKHTQSMGAFEANFVTMNAVAAASYAPVFISSTASAMNNLWLTAINGGVYNIVDQQPNGGSSKTNLMNSGVPAYGRSGNDVFSMDYQIVSNLPWGASTENCGGAACGSGSQPRQYQPVKECSGGVCAMTTSDTSEPIGIASNGNFFSGSGKTSTFVTTGVFPMILDGPCTAGDYVTVSSSTVGPSGYGAVGHDTGSATPPTSGWTLGNCENDGSNGSLTLPSTPSTAGVTLTPSSNGGIGYTYELVASTYLDQSQSAPSSAITTAVGPAMLLNGGTNTLTGLPSTNLSIYRTAMGSTMGTVTANCDTASGHASSLTISGFTGLTFAPTVVFSGGGFSPEPTATLIPNGSGQPGYYFAGTGSGCTSNATGAVTHNTYETGFIGETNAGSSFIDRGQRGDNTTPVAAGVIAPRVRVKIDQWTGAALTNPMTTQGDTMYEGASAPVRLGIGTAGQVLTVNSGATAPIWQTPSYAPTVSFAGGDLLCAHAGDTSILSTAITAGTSTTLTVGTLSPLMKLPGAMIGVTGASPAGLNTSGTSYYQVTSMSGNTLTFASLPTTWTSGGTIFLGCQNSTDAITSNYQTFANNTYPVSSVTAGATYSQKYFLNYWSSTTAAYVGFEYKYGSTAIFTPANSMLPTGGINSNGFAANVTWDIASPMSGWVISDMTSNEFSTYIEPKPSAGSLISVSGSGALSMAVGYNATGLGSITSYTSGATVTGSIGQTCLLSSFNDSATNATATATLTTANTLSGATFVVTNTGYGATAAPTTATAASGTATCSGTATLVTVLGGAQGNAMLLEALKTTQ